MSVKALATVSVLAGIPIAMGACTLLGWWLGSLLDGALRTGRTMQIVLALLFVAGSFRETLRLLHRSRGGIRPDPPADAR